MGAEWTLRSIDFSLDQGELVGLLGPSGCGKTTLLRLIAGFERPLRGTVEINGQVVAGAARWLPPERRGVGMVFQDYALFPHLDAWGNTCFGLRRGQDSSRAAWLLELLGLAGLERRYPHELSGGQRQRLALARALAPGPSVLLLDEPFSNLDVEVRLRLRAELPGVLAKCGTSALLVTHDPEEALAICDRVAVLNEGVLHQCAPPRQLVESPATAFVGRFVLQGNLLPARWRHGRVETELGPLRLVPASGTVQVTAQVTAQTSEGLAGGSTRPGHPPMGAEAQGGVERGEDRPEGSPPLDVLLGQEALALEPCDQGEAWILGREFLGKEWLYQVQLGGRQLRLRLPLQQDFPRQQRCRITLRPEAPGLLFPSGQRVQATV